MFSNLPFSLPSRSQNEAPQVEITRWVLDTRTIWVGDRIQNTDAASLLSLITDAERRTILRKYHIADAKMSLGSALLKRAFIAKCTGLQWSKITFCKKGDPVHGKPAWNAPLGTNWPTVDFNVSHQAGLVTLVGACTAANQALPGSLASFLNLAPQQGEEVRVGCDIVHPTERNDIGMVRDTNLDVHVSAFDQIFSDEELYDITYTLPTHAMTLPSGHSVSADQLGRKDRAITCDEDVTVRRDDGQTETFSSETIIDAKLRRFYTFFALKEAYIKLVGEGLLAPWIRNAEFRNVRAPDQGQPMRCSANSAWGGRIVGGGCYGPRDRSIERDCERLDAALLKAKAMEKPGLTRHYSFLEESRDHHYSSHYDDGALAGDLAAVSSSSTGVAVGGRNFSTASTSTSYLSLPSLSSSRSLSLASTASSTPYGGMSTCSSSTSLSSSSSSMLSSESHPFFSSSTPQLVASPCLLAEEDSFYDRFGGTSFSSASPSPYDECPSPTCTAFPTIEKTRLSSYPLLPYTADLEEIREEDLSLSLHHDDDDDEDDNLARAEARQQELQDFSNDDDDDQLELHLHNAPVKNVRMEVQAFEEDFMIATMISPASVLDSTKGEFPDWTRLSLEKDVLFWARSLDASREEGWRVQV